MREFTKSGTPQGLPAAEPNAKDASEGNVNPLSFDPNESPKLDTRPIMKAGVDLGPRDAGEAAGTPGAKP